MPSLASIIQRVALNQTLVYWQKTSDDQYGMPTYLSPVELPCRWEDKEGETVDARGRLIHYKAFIMMVVGLTPGSLVFLGTIAQWQAIAQPGQTSPTINQGGREVLKSNADPELSNLSTIYSVYL